FAHYLSMTLSTLVLDAEQLKKLTRFLVCVAAIISGEKNTRALVKEADSMRDDLDAARRVEQMWASARTMVDERTSRSWSSPHRASDRKLIGLLSAPDQVVAGLLVSLRRDVDPVDELLNRDAFQRACVGLAQSKGGIICGQIGDHGVMFLSGTGGPKTRKY